MTVGAQFKPLAAMVGTTDMVGNAGDVARVFLLSASAWTAEVVTYWLMAKAMGISVSFILVCLIMAVSNFAIMAPSTSGGVGPFEFFGVAIMLLFGFVKEEAAAYVFMVHAMILLPIILLGAVFMLKEGINFTKIIKEKEKEEDVK